MVKYIVGQSLLPNVADCPTGYTFFMLHFSVLSFRDDEVRYVILPVVF